jgi:hypothetical protein
MFSTAAYRPENVAEGYLIARQRLTVQSLLLLALSEHRLEAI